MLSPRAGLGLPRFSPRLGLTAWLLLACGCISSAASNCNDTLNHSLTGAVCEAATGVGAQLSASLGGKSPGTGAFLWIEDGGPPTILATAAVGSGWVEIDFAGTPASGPLPGQIDAGSCLLPTSWYHGPTGYGVLHGEGKVLSAGTKVGQKLDVELTSLTSEPTDGGAATALPDVRITATIVSPSLLLDGGFKFDGNFNLDGLSLDGLSFDALPGLDGAPHGG